MTNEFLRDLDQWDEESQGILLSLAEKDQLISVEEIEKGILGKGASLFEKIILNDDDSNRMISPFYEKFDITDSPNSGKNIMLDTKVSEFNFTGKDENNQSTFAYQTIVHELPGSEVYKQYKTEKAGFDAHFLKLYYEKLNTERIFNFTGRFCLLNIGKSYYNNIISNFPNQGIVSYYGENKHSVYVNSIQSEVSYIKKVIDNVYANNQLSEKEILKALKLALWQHSPTGSIVNAIGNINDVLADAVSLLVSGVGKLKIAENGYLPSEPNYQPFLLQQANSSPTITSMEIGISTLEQIIRKGMNSIEDYLDNINDAIPVGFRNAILEVTLFTNRLNKMIQSVMPILEDFGAEYFKLINAFVCGVINGLISLIEFIFQVISFGIGLDTSIKSYDDYAERQSYLEVIEEALDVLLKSVPELLNGLVNLIKTVNQEDIENLLQLITGLLGNVTRYELAYYGGAITFEIIIGVVLAILTGGTGNVAKAVGTSQKLLESLKIIGREFISSVTFGVSDLLAIFRNLIQSFIRACKNGFKGFLEWVRALLKQDGKHLDDVLEDIEEITIHADEIPALTVKDLDWMASRKIGNLGGEILKSSQIRKLRGILKQKGITLIVEDDPKYIIKLFKPMDNFTSFEGLTFFMRTSKTPKVGLFHAGTKQMVLTKNCTEIVAFHEMCHLKHFEEVGVVAYQGLNLLEKETYVWKQILANRGRWTDLELKDSLNYINGIRIKRYGLKPLIIR